MLGASEGSASIESILKELETAAANGALGGEDRSPNTSKKENC